MKMVKVLAPILCFAAIMGCGHESMPPDNVSLSPDLKLKTVVSKSARGLGGMTTPFEAQIPADCNQKSDLIYTTPLGGKVIVSCIKDLPVAENRFAAISKPIKGEKTAHEGTVICKPWVGEVISMMDEKGQGSAVYKMYTDTQYMPIVAQWKAGDPRSKKETTQLVETLLKTIRYKQ